MPSVEPERALHICIVADNASARFGGEAILPLHYFRQMRRRGLDVYLVVHERTRAELDELLGNDAARVRYIPDTWMHKALYRFGTRLPRRVGEATSGLLMQLVTQYLSRREIKELVKSRGVEIVHQPTPVSPKMPSLLFGFGVPVLIGPMNGGMSFPPAFEYMESSFSRHFVEVGRYLSNFANRLIPGKRRAAAMIVANERTRTALPKSACRNIIELPENGVDLDVWKGSAGAEEKLTRKFMFMGRLVDLKAVDLLMIALSHTAGAQLTVVGDGPVRGKLELLSRELGLEGRVEFLGWKAQAECARLLADALALVLPSLCECGGAVVLEAMASSVPVIATKWGGPADYLDSSCGFLIEPASRQAMIDGLAGAMKQLQESPELRGRLGAAGRRKVEERFDWSRKTDEMLEIYRPLITAHRHSLKYERTP